MTGADPSTLLAGNYLRLILMPTERCNLRCTYCYEDFENRRMERPVVAGVQRFIARRAPGLDLLRIDWFGGEPLLAREIVEEVQEHAQRLSDAHGFRLWGAMTTNAALLDPGTFRRLVALGVTSYQITLDGPEELHDRKRRTAGGGETFRRIRRHLEAIRLTEGSFEVLIRLHVDRENLEAMPELLAELAGTFGADGRFGVWIRELARLGGPNDEALCILEPGEQRQHLDRLRDLAEALGLRTREASRKACYAAAANAWVVRSTGDLAKCTVALSDPRNRIGRLLDSGRLEIDDDQAMPWIRGIWSRKQEELFCPADGLVESRKRGPAVLPVLGSRTRR